MRLILLASFLIACSSASATAPDAAKSPNRVCVIAAVIEVGTCDDLGRAGDKYIALWHHDQGVKWCIETLDAKSPIACAPLVYSPAEKAEQAIAAERAKHADPAAVPPSSAPVTPVAPKPVKKQ